MKKPARKLDLPMKLGTLNLSETEAMLVADLLYVNMLEAQELFSDRPTAAHHAFVVQAESLYQRAGEVVHSFN